MELEALNHFGEAEAECSEENREFYMALVKKKLIKDGFHKHKILSSDLGSSSEGEEFILGYNIFMQAIRASCLPEPSVYVNQNQKSPTQVKLQKASLTLLANEDKTAQHFS